FAASVRGAARGPGRTDRRPDPRLPRRDHLGGGPGAAVRAAPAGTVRRAERPDLGMAGRPGQWPRRGGLTPSPPRRRGGLAPPSPASGVRRLTQETSGAPRTRARAGPRSDPYRGPAGRLTRRSPDPTGDDSAGPAAAPPSRCREATPAGAPRC